MEKYGLVKTGGNYKQIKIPTTVIDIYGLYPFGLKAMVEFKMLGTVKYGVLTKYRREYLNRSRLKEFTDRVKTVLPIKLEYTDINGNKLFGRLIKPYFIGY